jgi:hypothetical protein
MVVTFVDARFGVAASEIHANVHVRALRQDGYPGILKKMQ